MFFLIGISGKVKPAGIAERGHCPACGRSTPLHLTCKYLTPHIFFIPTVKLRQVYLATCPLCASMMEIDPDRAKRLRRDPALPLEARDLTILQNNYRP